MSNPVLSICINTKNRAKYLAETLDSIVSQMLPSVEVIVVDGASSDETYSVMQEYSSSYPYIKYFRSEEGLGIDDGYDATVNYAVGEYCWLMPDDDPIKFGALAILLSKIENGHDLIILNLECFTKDLNINLNQKLFNFSKDKHYSINSMQDFFAELGFGLSYIGCVVIKRVVWFEHERVPYYGTYFVHVGVICGSSQIKDILFLHEPLIKHRSGNSSWTARSFEIWYLKWPKLVWSFNQISTEVKNKIVPQKPWRRSLTLLKSRAIGEYNITVFKKYLFDEISRQEWLGAALISIVPRVPLSLLLITFCLLFRKRSHYTLYNLMVGSPHPLVSRELIQLFGLMLPYSKN